MSRKKRNQMTQMTPEQRRIKREEDLTWRQYHEEQEAEMEAAFRQMAVEAEITGVEEKDPLVYKESRETGHQRRENAAKSKETLRQNAQFATSKTCEVHTDGAWRRRVRRTRNLNKRAGKVVLKDE